MAFNHDDSLKYERGNSISEEEIDINSAFDFLKRNKGFIFQCSLTGAILAALIGVNTRRTWEGEFQIVLDTPSSVPPGLSELSSFANSSSNQIDFS